MTADDKNENVKKDFHRSNSKRILHVLCLLVPIMAAFAGCFAADWIWGLFNDETASASELFKLACSLIAFAIPAAIIFFATRKENPIMKIDISNR